DMELAMDAGLVVGAGAHALGDDAGWFHHHVVVTGLGAARTGEAEPDDGPFGDRVGRADDLAADGTGEPAPALALERRPLGHHFRQARERGPAPVVTLQIDPVTGPLLQAFGRFLIEVGPVPAVGQVEHGGREAVTAEVADPPDPGRA